MHPTEIPDKIKPENPEDGIELPVAVPELTDSIKDVAALSKQMGMDFIDGATVRRLRQAGVALDSIGMMKMTRGTLFLTQQGLLHVNSQLIAAVGRAENDELRAKYAMTMGYISEKIMRVSKEIREGSDAQDGEKPLPGKYKSFQPGQVVQNNYYIGRANAMTPTHPPKMKTVTNT